MTNDTPINADKITSSFEIKKLTLWNAHKDDEPSCLKDQAKKILEEAAEVYAAWQTWEDEDEVGRTRLDWNKMYILEEITDVIQAAMNMAFCLGYSHYEIEKAMEDCQRRNHDRGRC